MDPFALVDERPASSCSGDKGGETGDRDEDSLVLEVSSPVCPARGSGIPRTGFGLGEEEAISRVEPVLEDVEHGDSIAMRVIVGSQIVEHYAGISGKD